VSHSTKKCLEGVSSIVASTQLLLGTACFRYFYGSLHNSLSASAGFDNKKRMLIYTKSYSNL
jgi:hypothetical protein